MKLFVAAICLFASNYAEYSEDDDNVDWPVDDKAEELVNPLLQKYVDCTALEKKEEQLYVDILRSEVATLLGAENDCSFLVQWCAKEPMNSGTNWKATIEACDITKEIVFYVDDNDSEFMPKELRLANDGQYNAAKAVIGLGSNRDQYAADTVLDEEVDPDYDGSGESDDESMDGILLDNGFTACPLILDQLCCNDITYDNKCVARVADVNVLTDCTRGACAVVTDAPVVAADEVGDLMETMPADVTAPTEEESEVTVTPDVALDYEVEQLESADDLTDDEKVELDYETFKVETQESDEEDDLAKILEEALVDYPELVEKIKGMKPKQGEDKSTTSTTQKPLDDIDGPMVACTMDINPVCCQGIEYDNACLANADSVTDVDTECVYGKCPTITVPVIPMPDPSVASVASAKQFYAKSKMVMCTKEYDPQCCDGVQFDNMCTARADKVDEKKCERGECKKDDDKKKSDDKKKKDDDDKKRSYAANSEAVNSEVLALKTKLEEERAELAQIMMKENQAPPQAGDDADENEEQEGGFAHLSAKAVVLDECDCPVELNEQCCGNDSDGFTEYASLCDAKCDGHTTCDAGRCSDAKKSAAAVGHNSYLTGGLVQSTEHSSQWNIMIVIIQLCILAVCCMSLGLSISFCFKNPNQMMGAGKKSYGRGNDMV